MGKIHQVFSLCGQSTFAVLPSSEESVMAHDSMQSSHAGGQWDALGVEGGSTAATLLAKKGYRVTLARIRSSRLVSRRA